jgi:hypothetical protein
MPKTQYAADPGPLVHTGAGKLVALLLSTSAAAAVTFTLYDNTSGAGTVLLQVALAPDESPVYLRFPDDIPFTFTTGLYLSVPATSYAHAWAIGF